MTQKTKPIGTFLQLPFNPGIGLMNRLNFPLKFGLISLLFALPLTLVLVLAAFTVASLGVRLVAGRPFTEADTTASQAVVIVNRSFVKQYLEPPALGQRLPSGEIVGVVEDVHQRGVTDAVQPEVYLAWTQMKDGLAADQPKIVLRTTGDPRVLVPTLRALVRAVDASVPLDDVRAMEDRVSRNLAKPRLYAVLFWLVAAFFLTWLALDITGAVGALA